MTMTTSNRYVEGWERGAEAMVSYMSMQWPELMTEGDDDCPSIADQVTAFYKDTAQFLRNEGI